MMKTVLLALLILAFTFCQVQAQLPEDDPLAESYTIHNGGADELVTIEGSWSSINIDVYKYYKAFELFPRDTLIKAGSWWELIEASFYDMDLCDLDKDDLHEIVAVWHSADQVEMVILKADPARLTVDSDNIWEKTVRLNKTNPAVYDPVGYGPLSAVLVKTGNFDSDSLGEFAVAYWADDGMIELTVYDVDDTLAVSELASIRDQEMNIPPEIGLCEDEVYLYDIECIDFNGDGIDEILLSGRSAYEPSGWQIFANVYSYNESENVLESKIKQPIYTQTNPKRDIGSFNTAGGKFFSTDGEEAVVSFFQYGPYVYGSGLEADTIANVLIPLDMDNDLNEMTIGDVFYQRQDTIPNECYYSRTSTLRAADVNNDGIDELISAFSMIGNTGPVPIFKIYQGAEPLTFSAYADLDHIKESFQAVIAFGDFYPDTLENYQPKELMFPIGDYFSGGDAELYQIQTNPDGSFDQLEYKTTSPSLNTAKIEPWLAGNLDGDIRLGKPKRYSVSEILQPLVILNAPPIHFDVFDDQIYDICRSYNENDGLFVANYIKESEQSTEVQTEINRDWSMSTTLSGGFSYWGLSVSSHLTETYGKKFSKVDGSSRTVTVGFEVEATVDDQIYATVMDYDIWEYPVYGNNELKGHVMVVDPQVVRNSWFDSKSWKGYSYIPNHEVGNILSYRRYPLISDNPMLIEKIKGDYGFDTSFLLSGNSSYNWFLNFTDFTENQATTTKEYSRDWGVSVSYWGAGFSMSGSYNSEDIQTQRTTVQSGIYLDVHLDAVDMSLGETRYEVTPYAYWANNGALVIDYAAAPELAAPGGEDTWWDTYYGYLPDPAFILPWRYDPEKGDAISEAKRHQTKDIVFRPQDPREGDIVTITTQVHNFSLLSTPGPIGVRFYVGDPDSGGILITGEGSISEVFTDGIIPPRGTMEVELQWKIPSGIGTFPRIYALIDADDDLTEIHENNNKSWNILQKSGVSAIAEKDEVLRPKDYHLDQNYPNPFNPVTTISYKLAGVSDVELSIYNLLGQRVAILVSKKQLAGAYQVQWDAGAFASGVYYYRLSTNTGFVQTRKLVLIK